MFYTITTYRKTLELEGYELEITFGESESVDEYSMSDPSEVQYKLDKEEIDYDEVKNMFLEFDSVIEREMKNSRKPEYQIAQFTKNT